eukprot:m.169084 g.169084  ORF g.169084 m.169084 type:complete len:153 (+) comp38971_c0_seq8:651-1109(+)
MPAHSLVVKYFENLDPTSPFICSVKGNTYACLFDGIRVKNIMNTFQLAEIQRMNLFSLQFMVDVWQHQYATAYNGGSTGVASQFDSYSIRYGFLMENKFDFISEVISVYTFHFKVKAEWDKSSSVLLIAIQVHCTDEFYLLLIDFFPIETIS